MPKPKSSPEPTIKPKLGRPKNPNGRKRFWWVGAHCTEAEKLQTQALAKRSLPGRPFSAWVRTRLSLPEKPEE